MEIHLKTFANIREVIGAPETTVELPACASLHTLFEVLTKKYGDRFDRQITDQTTREKVPFLVLVNKETYQSTGGMKTRLNHGDRVTILIPFDGG